ncbi:MAG: alkaline phosphatase D family protein [Nocardioidaceae bacterium]
MSVSRRGFLRFGGVTGAGMVARRLFGNRRNASEGPATAPVVAVWSGDATQTTVEISAYTTRTTLIGLAISRYADMSNATYLPSRAPNGAGWNTWSVRGLDAGAQYHYRITDTPRGARARFIGDPARFKTLQAVGVACTTRIAVGSCGRMTPINPAAAHDIVAWKPDRMMHLGDFGYPKSLTTDITTHMDNWSANSCDAGMHAIQVAGCMDYIVSDHDGNDNGKGENRPNYHDPITRANLEAWRRVVPARMADLRSPQRGRWRSDVEGNVRFVKLDTRSLDRTDTTVDWTDPRSPASSMLGPVQLAWLEHQIDRAVVERQLVVLFSDCAWNGTSPGPPIPVTYSDKWPSYIHERNQISDYAASKGAQMFIVFGDSHGLQQDDGRNERNGFATICCGPLDMELHMHYQDSYQWSYPHDVPEHGGPYRSAQQYQRLTIAQQKGSNVIFVTAEARDCSPAARGTPRTVRTMTRTYAL